MYAGGSVMLISAPVPIALQVELTNHCPYTCLGCPRTEHMDRPLGMMSFDTFRKVIDMVAPVQRKHAPLALHHMGESLLHPKLAEFAGYAASRGVPTALACRPNHLTPSRSEALLRAGTCIFVISLDGLDTPTLRRLTGKVAEYDEAAANIQAFVEVKQRLASHALVQIQMIAYSENEHQWGDFRKRFRFDDPTISASVKRYSTWTVPGLEQYGSRAAAFLGGRCSLPLWSFTVLWDGRVVPCNRDHNGDVVLGNVHDGLESFWRGKLYEELRNGFDDNELPPDHMCRKCASYPWNEGQAPSKEATAAWFGGEKLGETYSEEWWLKHWGHLVSSEYDKSLTR